MVLQSLPQDKKIRLRLVKKYILAVVDWFGVLHKQSHHLLLLFIFYFSAKLNQKGCLLCGQITWWRSKCRNVVNKFNRKWSGQCAGVFFLILSGFSLLLHTVDPKVCKSCTLYHTDIKVVLILVTFGKESITSEYISKSVPYRNCITTCFLYSCYVPSKAKYSRKCVYWL